MKQEKVLLDINIIIDVFMRKNKASEVVFALAETGKLNAYLSGASHTIIYYVMRKEFGHKKTMGILDKLNIVFKTAEINKKVLDMSIVSDFSDFEDAVQYYSAINAGVNYLITRNKKDFKKNDISVRTPEEFLAMNN